MSLGRFEDGIPVEPPGWALQALTLAMQSFLALAVEVASEPLAAMHLVAAASALDRMSPQLARAPASDVSAEQNFFWSAGASALSLSSDVIDAGSKGCDEGVDACWAATSLAICAR